MATIPIDIQIFPLGVIYAPPVTDSKKGVDKFLFKVRILDDRVQEVEIKLEN